MTSPVSVRRTEQGHRRFRKYILFGVLSCFVALLLLWLRIRLDDGKLLDCKVSPDGKYRAEYRLYEQSSATSTDDKAVGGRLDFYGGDTKWHEISVHYDLDHCQIAGAGLGGK